MGIKISIVTSCYNAEKTIERTIKSVISQNYDNIEYILIDGGSTDHTMDIVKKYKDNFSYIVSERDRGVADGFNKGILKATGDIIGIVNADDVMYPGGGQKLNDEYDENYDLFYGDQIVNDPKNGGHSYQKAKSLESIEYAGLPFCHQSVYIRKKCYEKNGLYSLEYKRCFDYELILKMYKNGARFKYIPYPLCEFSQGGISYTNPYQTNKERMNISLKYGCSKSKAFKVSLHYLALCYGKRILEKIGLLQVGRMVRQKLNRRVDYTTKK